MTEEAKKGPGQPRKLVADEPTLKMIEGLGRIHATSLDVAGYFNVSEQTWTNFKRDFPEAVAAYNRGAAEGKISLRRKQLEEALKGNPTMLIWCGKQLLGQTDKQELSGPNGGPMEMRLESPRDLLAARIATLASREEPDGVDQQPVE